MKKTLSGLLAGAVAFGALSAAALAAPPAAKGKMAKAAPSCPFCKMPLSAKKSAKTPVAIKMNGKTYYTCGPCKDKVAMMSTKKPTGKMKM